MIEANRGSRIPRRNLAIVAAAMAAATSLSGSCLLDTETSPCGERLRCPPGWVCSPDQDACVKKGSCGDGIRDDLEVCDDGNNQNRDGCSADCTSDETCGNGITDKATDELCDDGNTASGDGCSATCLSEDCGNFFVDRDFGEECDTGPGDSLGCNANCKFRRCGDGYINSAAEQCDTLGATSDTPSCDDDCTFPVCGDGHTNPNFKPPGMLAQLEQCDDGENTASCNGDGRNDESVEGQGACQRPACGDGYANPAFENAAGQPEQCDEGMDTMACNGNNNMNGPGSCRTPTCGDSYTNSSYRPPGAGPGETEECDAGGTDTPQCNGNNNGMFGSGSCRLPACGDGYFNPESMNSAGQLEQCDDGMNTINCNGKDNPTGDGNCQTPGCNDKYYNPISETCDQSASNPIMPCIAMGKIFCDSCMCF